MTLFSVAELDTTATTSAPPASHRANRPGLRYERVFAAENLHPFDELEWELRTATIADEKGGVVFEQTNVEVPAAWSQLATNVVASKYFRGAIGTEEREHSVKQLIERVAATITRWGIADGVFADKNSARHFYLDLTWVLVNQVACFNSPVWFNVGVEERPQCSACFINSVDDTMESILDLAKVEGMLFKFGSGAGVNLSAIRSSKEQLTTGGSASGPVSFMKGFDAFAGVIKSGGKTRRAAKMQILDADHPDILDFVDAKASEEKKAWALIEQGYDGCFNGEAYGSVFFQNANLSVRATDAFMRALQNDQPWELKAVNVSKGQPRPTVEKVRPKEIMRRIAHGTWVCGDPGMQFHDTINAWNPVRNSGPIRASNPCSEYMFLDDTACNLASINLRKFHEYGRKFDVEGYRNCVRLMIIAQDILVDNASYPTPQIEVNSHEYRPLGLGYANLGALLMSMGFAYDSDAGREVAGCLTAVLTGEAYRTSAELARDVGAFKHYDKNRDRFLHVIDKHRSAAEELAESVRQRGVSVDDGLVHGATTCWDDAYALGREHGYRNAQATVIAPTGTIAFLMDCATTGIEPDIALVKVKKLVGGGSLKLVNPTVPEALANLGYSDEQIEEMQQYLDEHETIEGAPHLKDEHLPVFDCAFQPMNGVRSIHYMGHLKMMAATQPFISGAISKTINMPHSATAEEIEQAYVKAWQLGLKAVAIYRDGSKRTQPLSTGTKKAEAEDGPVAAKETVEADGSGKVGVTVPAAAVARGNSPYRRRLPDERRSVTHKFRIGGHEGYLTVGLYPDGTPGEIFIRMAKQGSFVSGLMDAFATATSIMLQYGVPLNALAKTFSHVRFEPDGFTGNPDVPFARSVLDYIFRWLSIKFLQEEQQGEARDADVSAPAGESGEGGSEASLSSGPAGKTTREIDFHGSLPTQPESQPQAHAGGSSNGQHSQEGAAPLNGATSHGNVNGHGAPPAALNGAAAAAHAENATFSNQLDAPPCPVCGSIMIRNGACHTCTNCAHQAGCG